LTVITWFDSYTDADAPELGGKNMSLGVMTTAGLPVPPGFAITAAAFRRTLDESGVGAQLSELMAGVDPDSTASVSAAGTAARRAVETVEIAEDIRAEICAAYAELSARCQTDNVPVAVRSSATCEDQPDASFAGEHDTYLWVRGVDAVAEHVCRCWASLFTDRAIAYRRKMGYADDGAAMSVGIQKMVLPRTSGVAFTLNPTNGDRSQVAIDAAWGLGEAVVSGSVTPDNFLVDKVMGDITSRIISPKHVEHRLGDDDAVIEAEVEPERRDAPCLSDAEIRAVAALARRAERHYKCPQDVEWALDSQLPDGENVLLLQSRPETVWSRKGRTVNGVSADMYQSIVHNLLHPVGSAAVDTHSH
jgi:pyruvate,water dikinase